MSDELKPTGMELEDDFFDQNESANENEFKEQFEAPMPYNRGLLDDDVETPAPPPHADGDTIADEGKVDDFRFDDALAKEEQAELDELNAKMGTNFETRNALNEALAKVGKKEVNEEIENERKYVNYYQNLVNKDIYSDEDLIKENIRIEAIQNRQDPNSEEVLSKIENDLEVLESNGMLPYAAKSLRDNYMLKLKGKLDIVNKHDESQQLTEKEKKEQFKRNLQEGLNDIYKQGKFLGIQPTKEDMLNIYKDISKNKHIQHLQENPKDAVEFALFKKYKEVILKNLGKPNYEAGVKNTLRELGMSNSKPGTTGKDIANDNDKGDLSFLQQFVQ